MPPFSIENRFSGSKPPPYESGSICKEPRRPIYILDVLWYNYFGSYLLDKLKFDEANALKKNPATQKVRKKNAKTVTVFGTAIRAIVNPCVAH